MLYYPEGHYLIVYGGKAEDVSNPCCYDDVKIFTLENFTWVTPRISGDLTRKDRFGHSACIVDGQMIVFGGMFQGSYADDRTAILELSNCQLFSQPLIILDTGPDEVKRHNVQLKIEEAFIRQAEATKSKEINIINQILKDSSVELEKKESTIDTNSDGIYSFKELSLTLHQIS